MRAIHRWLAAAPLLVLVGCGTFHDRAPSAGSRSLSETDRADLAEALAHYSQALISESTLGGNNSSLWHFRQAAQKDPAYLPLCLSVAASYLARRDYDQALFILSQARAYHPDSVDLSLLLGIVYQLKQMPRQAIREYQAATRAAPDRADAYVRLATLHATEEHVRAALSVVDAGFKRVKDPARLIEFCDSMARLYFAGNQPAYALPFLERIQARKPENLPVKEMIARCQAATGHRREAIALLLEVEKEQPGEVAANLLLGELYEAEGDLTQAEEALSRVAKSPAADTAVALRLAMVQLKTGRAKAVKTLQDAAASHPDDLGIRAFLGLLYSHQKQYAEAVKEFEAIESVAEKDPVAATRLHPQFYFWYGSACDQMGRFKDAERLMERCVAMDPESAQALNYLAYLWAERGVELDKAQEYVEKALKLDPGEGSYLDTLGWVYYKKGAYHEALAPLKKALATGVADAVVADHLGDTWFALQDQDKAVRFWKLSLRQDPGNVSVRQKLIKAGLDPKTLPVPPSKTE